MAPKIKLTYFNIQGVAEKVRLALVLNGVDFEDCRVSRDEWATLKPSTPYGQLPTMSIDGGKEFAQSSAMVRWAGRLGDGSVYPQEPSQMLRVEEAIGLSDDLARAWGPCLYISMKPEMFGHAGISDEAKAAMVKSLREQFLENTLPAYFGWLSKFLEESGGQFFAGPKPTIADCTLLPQLARFISGDLEHIPPTCMDKFPALTAWMERMRALPAIKAWYEKK
eukprot:TRINITY_DN6781_c0_g1_i2.p2 TRINITY_DN6781_c0_g1~~TRINITY_DN6781_c0_g1_i2.p2  ORF type:complete len:223 (+),score=83.14 TRINITY_DN6781_c0_g1_i2:81-749(+)